MTEPMEKAEPRVSKKSSERQVIEPEAASVVSTALAASADAPATNNRNSDSGGAQCARERAGRALIDAVAEGDLEKTRELLPRADLSATNPGRRNALQNAAWHMQAACLRELLPHFGAGAANSALRLAAERGWAEGIKTLLPVCDANAGNTSGWTALMLATTNHDNGVECLRLLLPHCNPAAMDSEGRTALFWAAVSWDENVEALLPACDPNATDKEGRTALMLALLEEQEDCAKVLIRASDLLILDKDGKTALDHALSLQNKGVSARLAKMIQKQMAMNEKTEISAEMACGDHCGKALSGGESEQRSRLARRAPRAL